jgi:hypothetical protein
MPDFEEQERDAFATGMKFMAEVMAEIGWQSRLSELTREQALILAQVAVNGYFHKMHSRVPRPTEDIPFP